MFVRHRQGDYKNAVSCFTKAIELDNKKAIFFNNRGLAYFRLQPPKYQESLNVCICASCMLEFLLRIAFTHSTFECSICKVGS